MSGFRLSPQQKHLFRLGTGFASGAGRTVGLARLESIHDPGNLNNAIATLAERFEILRTVFPPITGLEIPLQSPLDSAQIELVRHRVLDSNIDPFVRTALQRPFDLARLPLQRIDLVDAGTAGNFLLWTQPTLCGDSASMAFLMRELGALLTHPHSHPNAAEQPLQYADIAEWLNEILEGEDAAEGLGYWRRQLAQIPAFALPIGDQGPGRAFKPSCVDVPLEAATVVALKEAADRFGTPLESLIEAAWAVLLAKFCDSDRVTVGAAADGRFHEDLDDAVGLFARYLPVDVTCDSGETLGELSTRLAASRSDATEWQEYFCWDHLARSTASGQAPHLSYLFEYTILPSASESGGDGLVIERIESQPDQYAVKLSCCRNAEGLASELWYDSARFDRVEIERLARSLGALLISVAQSPKVEIGGLCMTDPEERQRVLYSFNPVRTKPQASHSVIELIAEQVTAHPEAIAVCCGAKRLSYRQLWDRANSIAGHLDARGIGCESLVAVCCERSVDMVAAILGVLRAGAAYLPIDPGYPAARRDFMLNDAQVSVVLTQAHLAGRFGDDHEIVFLDDLAMEEADTEFEIRPESDQLAYVIYTSGSTGRPKGVSVDHGNLLASTTARFAFYDESPERFLLLSSYAFDSSAVGLFWTLTTGGTLLLPEEGDEQDIVLLSQIIEQDQVTHTLCLPTLYALLLDQLDPRQLSSIRTVIVAGETCPPNLVQTHFTARPEAILVNEYGPTEATVWASACRLGAKHGERRIPIGRPTGDSCIYVLDGSMMPVPAGVTGEIYIGGPGVTRGYLDRPGQTADKFVPDPFSGIPGARLYRSGDRARHAADGTLEFLGRMDHQVKIRGYRIEPGEIESRLAAHPSVHQAAVTAVDDHPGGQRLVAYYSFHNDSNPALPELLDFLRGQLPDWMIPAIFVALDTLPLMPNGKVDRESLPEPDQARPDFGAEYIEPSGPLETYLAERWRDILHADTVGAQDNFFELGGNSIQAAIFMNRLRGDLNEFIHVGRLFENPTIRQLAEYLGEEHEQASGLLTAGKEIPEPATIQPSRDQDMLEKLGELSDEQVKSLLEEMLPESER